MGATLTWRINPKISFTTYGAYTMVDETGGSAYTNLTSWMAGFYFPDAFIEGNLAGILGGQPIHRVAAGKGASLLSPNNIGDRATPYQIEAFYNFKLSDNISVTPGAFIMIKKK